MMMLALILIIKPIFKTSFLLLGFKNITSFNNLQKIYENRASSYLILHDKNIF